MTRAASHTVLSHGRQADPGHRRQLEERLLDAVEVAIPGAWERVLLRRSATPLTFGHYTLRPGGGVGGVRQQVLRANLHAPGHRPFRGVFMAGDHVFPGQGTVGVALSGVNACRDTVEYLGGKPLL